MVRYLFIIVIFSFVPFQIIAQDWEKKFSELYEEGDNYYFAFDYESALINFNEAYSIAKNHLTVNEAYRAAYSVLISYSKNLQENEARETIIDFFQAYGDQLNNQQKYVLYLESGLIDINSGKFTSSIENLERALSHAELDDNILGVGYSLINMSISNIYLSNFLEAENLLNRANALEIKDQEFLAFLNLTYFNVYNYTSRDTEGYSYLITAYDYSKNLDNPFRYINTLVQLSYYYINQNNFSDGIGYATEGLQLSEETGQIIQTARFCDILGRIYYQLGEYELSLNFYNQAITIYEKSENEQLISDLRLSIAQIFYQQKEYEQAGSILRELLDKNPNPYQKIYLNNTLSDVEIKKENFDEAKKILDSAIAELDSNTIDIGLDLYDNFLRLPNVELQQKFEYAYLAYNQSKSVSLNRVMGSEIRLAKLYETINSDSAFKYAYAAIEKLENRRVSTSVSSLKRNLTFSWQPFYYEVANWEINYRNNYKSAFQLFEQSKSRTLFDQIFENQKTELITPENPASIKLLELQKRIDQFYQSNASAIFSEENNNLTELARLELEYATELDKMKSSDFEWSKLEYPTVSTLDDAKELLNENVAYLSYGLRQEFIYVFLITSEEEIFERIRLGTNAADELAVLVNEFRNSIISQESESDLFTKSQTITNLLIDPVRTHLTGIDHIIISPDGPLHLLPFEALRYDDNYLIEDFSVKYLPSISVYNQIEYQPTKDFSKDLLAVAGTGFESGDGFIGSSSQSSFATLPYSLAEVDSISRNFSNSTILKNEEVTEFAFKNLTISDYRLLHLATHGNIDEKLPDQSGLILSKKIGTESLFGEDGYLNAREISQIPITAELVVLSACNTGTGKVINGEGVMGLQQSFLSAGASSVIVSLWNIFDRSTPIFMNNFYEYLLEFEEEEISFLDEIRMMAGFYTPELVDYKTRALQQAKIEMIDHPYFNHPVHWAPFVLTGK